jgi:TetR/AcrR family tetracycline transcriptional repressor
MAKPALTSRAERRTEEHTERLSEERLVQCALELASRIGLERLTMRELAKELGVTQMAAYYYVKNKRELLSLVVDSTLASAELPPPEAGPWDERIRLFLLSVFDVVAAAPGVGDIMVDLGLTSEGNRLINDTLQLLLDGGFDDRNALMANSTLHTFTFGHFSIESRLHRQSEITHLRSHPALDRVMPSGRDLHGRDYYSEGLELVLSGMRMMLERQRYTSSGAGKRNGRKTSRASQ